MSGSGTGGMRGKRENELSVLKPGNSVLGSVEAIDVVDEQILLREFFHVNNQCLRRTVEVSLAVEECATYRADEFAGQSGRQPLQQRCTRIVDQTSQPAHQLRRTAVEPGVVAIRTLLVVVT